MRPHLITLLAWLTVAGVGPGARAAGPDRDGLEEGEDDERPRVSMRALADREVGAPGSTLLVAAELSVDAGWHIYWHNPGASGAPTRVTVAGLPPGVRAQPVVFPLPKRHVREGDVDFVHEGKLLFLVPLSLGPEVKPGLRFEARLKASWLVCKEACITGEGEAKLSLSIALRAGPKGPAAPALEAALAQQSPTPLPADVSARLEGATLRLEAKGAEELQWFPQEPRDHGPDDYARQGVARGAQLSVTYPARLLGWRGAELRGLLLLRRGGKQTAHWVGVALPRAERKTR